MSDRDIQLRKRVVALAFPDLFGNGNSQDSSNDGPSAIDPHDDDDDDDRPVISPRDIQLREQVIALAFPELSSVLHGQQCKTNDGVEEVEVPTQRPPATFNEQIDAIPSHCNEACNHSEDTDLSTANQEETVMTAYSEWLGSDTNEEDEDNNIKTTNDCGLAAAFLFTLFIIASFITTLLSIQRYNLKQGENHASMTTSTRATQRFDQLAAELHVVSPRENTPQFQALWFLIHSDKQYNLLDDDIEKDGQDSDWQDILPNLEQRYALLVVYYGLGGKFAGRSGWASLMGALLHECSWPGVQCEGFVVTELVIDPSVVVRSSDIAGQLPAEIGRLWNLRRLIISDASALLGEIPLTLYSLSNLYALQLSNLSLSSTLASEISSLSNLIYLNLQKSGIVGTIPSALSNLIQLRFLDVSQNSRLTGTVPTEFGSFSWLEKADFRGTGLTGSIPHAMCDIPRLSMLSIDCPKDVVATNMTASSSSSKPREPIAFCHCCAPSCDEDPGR
jgi:hypothetical protein